jgi:hypothetical protein
VSEEKDNPGKITPELCAAYRETLETKIVGMERSIKLSVAMVGFVISVIVLLTSYLM